MLSPRGALRGLRELPGEIGDTVSGVRDPLAALPTALRHLARSLQLTAPPPGWDGPLPPGLIVPVPGRGEMFVRDTHPQGGGERGTLLLLHGWLAASDVNWWPLYEPLRRAGWRVIAVDARGHGRGLRPTGRFRLADCADDAAALLRTLSPGPVTAVGYSMGGAVAQVLALRDPELLSGVVLCATAAEWRTAPQLRAAWYFMSALQLGWRLAPRRAWEFAVSPVYGGHPPAWFPGELARGAPWDIAEAGREMSRFDSRPWLAEVRVPAAVIATAADVLVPLSRQRALARALGASVIEIPDGHLAALTDPEGLFAALEGALVALSSGAVRREPSRRPVRLRVGDSGDAVIDLQRLLHLCGESPGQLDGLFGPATGAAVARFRASQGLPGRAGAGADGALWDRLRRVAADRERRSAPRRGARRRRPSRTQPRSAVDRRLARDTSAGRASPTAAPRLRRVSDRGRSRSTAA